MTRERHRRKKGNEHTSPIQTIKNMLGPFSRETSDLVREVDIIRGTRLLHADTIIRVNPYAEDVEQLASDPEKSKQFDNELIDYEEKWGRADYTSKGKTRRERVFSILDKHPYVQSQHGVYAVPMAALMEIANQSDVGIYTQEKAAVRSLDDLDTAFTTLAHNEYWRESMGKHAVLMAERFAQKGKRMDLVMVGDGSGDLGATMGRTLMENNIDFRLIHLDVGDGMLKEQKKAYLEAGIDEGKIVGIKGSVIKDLKKIKEALPDYEGGFFVLHEILDALRTHALVADNYGITELHQILNLPQGVRNIEAFDTTHPLLKNIGNYLPFYNPVPGKTRMMPFSPQGVTCLKEILNSAETVSIYTGDYGSQFILGERSEATYQELPMRVYGRGIEDKRNYMQVLDKPVDMTADVLPSIVYLSKLYGGKVEHLVTQEDYIGMVDPTLHDRIPDELERIKQRAENGGYAEEDKRQLIEDSLFVTELCNPGIFAAQITKGL